jgi:NAD(P)H-hydrate repair Nnr-like enzyme with NAD(P)H-hydrate epimerase domain
MSLLSRSGVLMSLAIVVFLAVGCGGTEIDASKVEDQLEASVEKSQQAKVSSVDCPSGVEVESGAKFSCIVHLSGGGSETATLLIRDKDANLTLLDLKANK